MRKVDPRKLRVSLGLNQSEFWERILVTQSGGSRYENGRTMPGPVRKLLGIVYLKEKP
jgi:transcriptional regulator with XRE-family HTH domain